MSSILIKGMAMPYGCANCSYMGGAVYDSKGMAHYSCNVDVEGIRGTDVTNEVVAMYEGAEESFPNFCPLIEVKEPHGRLIDATFEENHYASMLLDPTPDVTEQDKHKARIIIDALRMAGTVIEPEVRE